MVPDSVLIPAGQTNATFDITVLDDAELDGTQTTFIIASATNYVEGIAAFAVSDNETATLGLTLPASGHEGSGVVTGLVSVSTAPAANVIVDVVSSRPGDLQSGRAVVSAGQTSAPVLLAIVDDLRIDGTQRATVTAQVAHWTSAIVEFDVLDNESTNLVLTVPAQVVEGEGTRLNAGLVQTAGTLPTDLLLTVASSDPPRVRVPNEAVTIPAGRTSATFDLAMADNQATEGTQSVWIVVSAVGFLSATQTVAVADNDAHHFEFGVVPSPQYTGTTFQVTLTAREAGGQRVFAYNGSASLSLTGDAAGLQLRTPASIAPRPLDAGVGRWGDFNNDGRPDVLLVNKSGVAGVVKLFRNDGNGIFTEVPTALPEYLDAHAVTLDYANDGRLDVFIMGRVGIQYADVFGTLYRNIGNATFQDTGAFLPGTRLGFADAGDYDGDGLTDLLYHGRGTNLGDVVYLLRNSRS